MKIINEVDLSDFEFWGPAEDHASLLDSGDLDEIGYMLEEEYPDGIDETELNDLFAYDFENMLELIGKAQNPDTETVWDDLEEFENEVIIVTLTDIKDLSESLPDDDELMSAIESNINGDVEFISDECYISETGDYEDIVEDDKAEITIYVSGYGDYADVDWDEVANALFGSNATIESIDA